MQTPLPKIGIRPTIDGRLGGVRESLEERTMQMAQNVAQLIQKNITHACGLPVEVVIADTTIGGVAESAQCALEEGGYSIETVLVTGGGTKNPLWLRIHADATGKTLVLPEESESVLLGAGVLAATAAKLHPDVFAAMKAMARSKTSVEPRAQWRAFYDAKFEVFRSMLSQGRTRREKMAGF